MEKKLCSSAQSYWRISKLAFSLVLLISLCTPLLPAQATTTNANQVQAADLLQIPVAQSLRLDQIILDGETSPASLKLERFEVFAPDVQIVVHDGQGHEQIQSRPASAYFKGEIAGAPHSLVVLSADPDGTMRGIAQQGEKLWILAGGTAAGGPHLGLVSREVAQSGGLMGLPPFQCGVEGRMKELTPPSLFHLDTVPAVPLSAGQFYKVPVAIETDGEFYTLFGNSDAATSYIGNLFAYASVIYNREASAKLIVSSVSLWSGGPTSDPWNHTSTLNGLEDFQSYWNANRTTVSRATAHFLSGRSLGGGIAYLGVLCNTTYGYGYSANISGQFQINNPQPVWDIIVVTHEIGHNFSSPHTHCYGNIGGNSNPVDACYVESGTDCWSGATSLPGVNSLTGGTSGGGNGTIMSYCHQLGGGLSNIALTFGQNHTYGIAANRVSSKIADYVASVAASYPNCISVGSSGTTYTLTLAKAGTGTGTVSGGGSYAAGATVNLTATPASGSTFAGWSPSPCAASFAMPANNLTCTATFNQSGQAASAAVGVFRAGTWYLDANGNGLWDGCQQDGGLDLCLFNSFGQAGDLAAAGDWNGDGKAKVGVFRNGTWYLDYNGNGLWDGCSVDRCYVGSFGQAGDLAAAGDWNGDGKAKVGVFRNGTWYLDYNGNGLWDGCQQDGGLDLCLFNSFGQAGDLPAAGDWNGDGKAKVGVFRNGTWYLDYNGNGLWDGCSVDRCYVGSFGQAGDLPAAGDWNGDGKAKVGVFRNGTWYLDYNGNGLWDGCSVDRCYVGSFGVKGDLPVAGKW